MDWSLSAKIRFNPLHFAQVVNEFDDSPSSISLFLYLLLLRWHCYRNKLYILPYCGRNVCFLSVRVSTPPAQFPVQILQQNNELVVNPRKR